MEVCPRDHEDGKNPIVIFFEFLFSDFVKKIKINWDEEIGHDERSGIKGVAGSEGA